MSDRVPASIFNDGKDPEALRTIGEVAKALGIRQHVLRYWEEQFPSLKPVKRSGGRRYYRPEDVELIATIDRLVHREGYTLRGARQVITEQSKAPQALPEAPTPHGDSPDRELVDRLRGIRRTLSDALDSA